MTRIHVDMMSLNLKRMINMLNIILTLFKVSNNATWMTPIDANMMSLVLTLKHIQQTIQHIQVVLLFLKLIIYLFAGYPRDLPVSTDF